MSPLATTPAPPLVAIRWTWDFGIGLNEADSLVLTVLLNALRNDGRLAAAARLAGISYRTAWGLLHRCESQLGQALVLKTRGQGTRLSEFGEQIALLDNEARSALREAHMPWAKRLNALLSAAEPSAPGRLPIAASHDLALGDWIENGRHVQVDVFWRGSEEALASLARSEFEVAGFHLPAAWTAAQRLAWLSRWLKPRQYLIFPLMLREHGMLTAAGNPLAVTSLADVARLGLRMVNRQRGSGTRNMIDELLAANGLQPQDIPGYAHEEFTHHAVAGAIVTGQVDVGFGIRAVASRYDLGFVSLGWDHYCLALRASIASGPAVTHLLRRLQGETFHKRAIALIDYRFADAVKLAGHSCPTVAGAWLMTVRALHALYGEAMPVRGDIAVALRERLDSGVAGVIGSVAGLLAGAAGEGGFKGLGGRYSRRNLLQFGVAGSGSLTFRRRDTNVAVDCDLRLETVPADPHLASLLGAILGGTADAAARRLFGELWQDRVRRILIDYYDDPDIVLLKLRQP